MTKRVAIELIQNRMGSGEAPADLRRRYPYAVIERLVAMVYSDQGYLDYTTFQDMAMAYTLSAVASGNDYEVTLTPKPVGSFGIVSVIGKNNTWYPVQQGAMENFVLSIANPASEQGCLLVNGSKLVFKNCSPGDSVTVTMVPDFHSLDDGDELILPGGITTLFEAVVKAMQATDQRPQERFNDNRDDTIPKRNEWQSGPTG